MFLQNLYYQFGIDKICKSISKKYKFNYDLNDILSRLIYSRVIHPCSKQATLPIVEMGMFIDSDGIPLSICIHPGNTNEQVTLKPLEQKIISDFKMSKFVVCTDAGLASKANRKFNDIQDRAFIVTHSVYTRTDITDALHDAFGFRTDYQAITKQTMKKIVKSSKTTIRYAKY